jgi:high-affinity K+ transport system ATPase subunit B
MSRAKGDAIRLAAAVAGVRGVTATWPGALNATMVVIAFLLIVLKPLGAAAILQRNMLVYGARGVVLPFVAIRIIDVMLVTIGLA